MGRTKRWLVLVLTAVLVSSNVFGQMGTTLSAKETEETTVTSDTEGTTEDSKPGESSEDSESKETAEDPKTEGATDDPKTEESNENSEPEETTGEEPTPSEENVENGEKNTTDKTISDPEVEAVDVVVLEETQNTLLETQLFGSADTETENEATEIYVSSSGSDDDEQNNGSREKPYATLAKAVGEAEDGATIYVMSDLEISACARIDSKHLTITSFDGDSPCTIKRSGEFDSINDTARGWYNPAMIEVQTAEDSAGLTLTNIILDDNNSRKGSVFAQAVNGGSSNTDYVQDAIIASNATESCTITLGEGAVLRNFGGMSAVRATDQAKIVMKSGSVIEDTKEGLTRTKGASGSVGPAGAIWLQGGTLVMEEGSTIQNIDGRAVYADGGTVEIGGTITGITGNNAMWQNAEKDIRGTAIYLRNYAKGTLTATALIERISGGNMIRVDENGSFEMKNGSKITACPELKGDAIYAEQTDGTNVIDVVIDGEISNVYAGQNHILHAGDNTKVTIGANGTILNNHVYYGAVYINGTNDKLDIYGKINENISTDRGGGVVLSNNGGTKEAVMYDGAEIRDNYCEETGGGIMVNVGTFTMNGGTISGNMSKMEGGGVFVRKGGQFMMNGGKIENNAAASFGGGVCFEASDYGNMVPKAELKGGSIQNNRMKATITKSEGDSFTVSGGSSNDLAVSSTYDGKSGRYLFISGDVTIGNKAVYFKTEEKTVTPADDSLDIELGNTSAANVTALNTASSAKGWGGALATFWAQRSGAAKLTVDGLTGLNADLPVYVIALPVGADGTVVSGATEQICVAQKSGGQAVSFTLSDISGNGCAIAIVQPTANYGTLSMSGPATIKKNQTGADYSVTYTVTYNVSDSMRNTIAESGNEAAYILEIDQDTRLGGTPGEFNGKSITVTYQLSASEFAAGKVLTSSAKLKIQVGGNSYMVLSDVVNTRMIEETVTPGGGGSHHHSGGGSSTGGDSTTPTTPAASVTPNGNVPAAPRTANPITNRADNVVSPAEETVEEQVTEPQEILDSEDEGVPLADQKLDDHRCCILHFLIMLLALLVGICEMISLDKQRKRLQELRD